MDNIIDLSVIIPCHNLEQYLTPLLNSLANQELGKYNVEYLFICDSCTDRTHEIIQNFSDLFELDFQIFDVNFHRAGLSRNFGLDICQGKYIWFLDGDDWLIENDAIKTVLDQMYKRNIDFIKIAFKSNLFTIQHPSMVWQYCFSKNIIGSQRFGELQRNEDVEFMKEFFNRTNINNFPEINLPLYFYNYDRPNSLTTLARLKIIE